MSSRRASERGSLSRAITSRYGVVTSKPFRLYRLVQAGFTAVVGVVSLTSVVVAVLEIAYTGWGPTPAIAAASNAAAEVAAPAPSIDLTPVSTPRAADLVTARKNADRAMPLLATAELEAAFESTTAPGSMIAGTATTVEVSVTNTGLASWAATGEHAVHLSYHWFAADGSTVQWDGTRTVLQRDVAPGDVANLVVDLRAPGTDGSYILAWDMVKEGSGWFTASATAMKTQSVAVSDGVTVEDLRAVARQAAISAGFDPEIFDRQIMAESGFDPDAHSPAGARGIAQITPATAQSWGVDASDPVAALQAAAQHMAGYVKKYGDYSMALAAYNAGPRAVERYGGVPPFAETRNYVAKILGGQ